MLYIMFFFAKSSIWCKLHVEAVLITQCDFQESFSCLTTCSHHVILLLGITMVTAGGYRVPYMAELFVWHLAAPASSLVHENIYERRREYVLACTNNFERTWNCSSNNQKFKALNFSRSIQQKQHLVMRMHARACSLFALDEQAMVT
jgi:hypothetical protein